MNTSPNSSWFYAEHNEKKGPITFGMLQQRFKEGLPQSTLVWTEGMEQWALASSVPGLTTDTMANNPYAPPSTTVVETMQATGSSLEPVASLKEDTIR